MSWSVSFIGKPDKVATKLEEQVDIYQGDSKKEYEEALPFLKGLLALNTGHPDEVMQVTAAGHAYIVDGKKVNSRCTVKIEAIYGVLV